MPTVIDSFIMQMGWDAGDFKRGSKDIQAGLKRTTDEADKSAKLMEAAGKRAANYFASLRTEVVGLFLAFAGAHGLKDFATGLIENDAHVGRFSKNIGVATEKIGAWQAAVREMGGGSQDSDGALATMAKAISDVKLGLRPENAGVLQALGLNQDNMKDPSQMLLRIAEASRRMDPMVFNNLVSRLGFTEPMIALLERGNRDLEQNMPRWEKMAALQQANADAAAKLISELGDLQTIIEGAAQPAVEKFSDALTKLAGTKDGLEDLKDVVVGVLGAIGAAAVVANAPLVVLAASIAGLLKLKHMLDGMTPAQKAALEDNARSVRNKALSQIGHGDFSAAWGTITGAASQGLAMLNGGAAPGGGTGPNGIKSGGGGGDTRSRVISFFRANGFSEAEAQGIWAGIWAESKGDPNALGPLTKSGHRARGIGQWLSPDRIANFQKVMGHPLAGSTLDQQLAFMLWEMRNTHKRAGLAIGSETSSTGALADMIRLFFMPGSGTMADWRSGIGALGLPRGTPMPRSGTTITFGDINVTAAPGADPRATGRAITDTIRSRMKGVQADGAFN